MYKLPDIIVQFIEIIQTWREELTAGGKNLAEVKTQRGIFHGEALSQFLFVIAMMPLNHILRKSTAEYRLSKLQEKINHLIDTDNIKPFAKTEKIIGNPYTKCEKMQSKYKNGIWN